MNHHDTIENALLPLRNALVPLSSPADTRVLKHRIIFDLRDIIAGCPRRIRRRRLLQYAAVTALSATVGSLGALLTIRASAERASMLQVEPMGDAQLVWSDAATELRRLAGSDSLPARGTLAALGDYGAKLTTPEGVEVELGGHSRISLRASYVGSPRRSLVLEQGTVRCRVPASGRSGSFAVLVGSSEIRAEDALFSVTRAFEDSDGLCLRVEGGMVEATDPTGTSWQRAGHTFGCQDAE